MSFALSAHSHARLKGVHPDLAASVRRAIQLTAVDSARDAIGATVHLKSGDQSWTSQLTAGDGFQASNERRLVLGLGEHAEVDTVEVIWPSGTRQVFRNLAAGHDWLVVENREPLRAN